VRGSMLRRTGLPLTLRVTGTGPGPTALTAPCASTPGALARTAPAATPPAPTVFRKLRLEKPGSSFRLVIQTDISANRRLSQPQPRLVRHVDGERRVRAAFDERRCSLSTSPDGAAGCRPSHFACPRAAGSARGGGLTLVLVHRQGPWAGEHQAQERADEDHVVFDPVALAGGQRPVHEESVWIVHFPDGDPHVDEERERHPERS